MKLLVITKYRWRTREKKHEAIKKLTGFQIDTLYKDLKPDVKDGRITEAWFEKNVSALAKGKYDFAILHFSERDGRKWKLEDGVRGSNFGDSDNFGEAWVCADEDSTVRFKDGSKRDKYTKVIPHEIAHELKRQGKTTLEIHDYDFKNEINNLEGFWKAYNGGVLAALEARVAALKARLAPQPYLRPLAAWDAVSQPYGNPDPILYTITGRHIGTDFPVPLGTPIYAPKTCLVTRSDFSAALGYWCEVKVDDWYMVALHLESKPECRTYERGEVIGRVGKTGKIIGVHAHLEGWVAPMDRDSLTKDNWNKKTFDIKSKIK